MKIEDADAEHQRVFADLVDAVNAWATVNKVDLRTSGVGLYIKGGRLFIQLVAQPSAQAGGTPGEQYSQSPGRTRPTSARNDSAEPVREYAPTTNRDEYPRG